jgi:hypothetical protein
VARLDKEMLEYGLIDQRADQARRETGRGLTAVGACSRDIPGIHVVSPTADLPPLDAPSVQLRRRGDARSARGAAPARALARGPCGRRAGAPDARGEPTAARGVRALRRRAALRDAASLGSPGAPPREGARQGPRLRRPDFLPRSVHGGAGSQGVAPRPRPAAPAAGPASPPRPARSATHAPTLRAPSHDGGDRPGASRDRGAGRSSPRGPAPPSGCASSPPAASCRSSSRC